MRPNSPITFASLFFAVLIFSFAASAQQRSPTLVIRNVTVIDVTAGRAVPGMTVRIDGSHIAAVGAGVNVPRNAEVVDGTGKFLIPGLWDMHVHIFNNVGAAGTNNSESYFPMLIANGVTGVRDMFTDADDIRLVQRWQSEAEAGKLIAPRISIGSSIVDGVPVVQRNSLSVATPDEARQTVRDLKKSGAGFIKIYENLSRESFFAIADESRKLKIPFAGHVPNTVTAAEASTAGQKSIEHMTRMLIACSSAEDKFKDLKNEEWTPALRAQLMESYSEQKCTDVARLFVKNGTWLDPTAVVLRSRLLSESESFANDPRLRYVPSAESKEWLGFASGFRPANRKNREARYEKDLEILKVMHRSGVPILAGTDVGNPYVFAGFSLHDELEELVRAGLTPLEALRAATLNPVKYLGVQKSHGTIAKGKTADLVLLDANPLTAIANTRKINAVITNGRLIRRSQLDTMLHTAAEKANR